MKWHYANYPKIQCRQFQRKHFGIDRHPARPAEDNSPFPLSKKMEKKYKAALERHKTHNKNESKSFWWIIRRLQRAGIDHKDTYF